MGRGLSSSPGLMPGFHVIFNAIFSTQMKMLRKMIDSKSLENSQENIVIEFFDRDLVKLQFCNLNTATLP